MILEPRPNPHWRAILNKIAEIQEENEYTFSSRGAGYSRNVGDLRWETWECEVKFYPKGTDLTTRHVYIVRSHLNMRGEIATRAVGPYIDTGVQFWTEMVESNKTRDNVLITDKYEHYTVHLDSRTPRGFGGAEWKINLYTEAIAQRLLRLGLNVTQEAEGGNKGEWFLTTRNLWSQGTIPEAHRHMFTPNCKILPTAPIEAPDPGWEKDLQAGD